MIMSYDEFIGFMTKKSTRIAGTTGTVHSLFTNALNLELAMPFPNLLTLGNKGILGAPNSLYLPEFTLIRRRISKNDRCLLKGNKLFIGADMVCQIKELPVSSLTSPGNTQPLKLAMIETLLREQNPYMATPSYLPFYWQVLKECQQLTELLVNGKWAEGKGQIRRLLGLGVGLTPSGDDVLTGMLLVLQTEARLQAVLQEFLFFKKDQLLEGTNKISAHQLYFMQQGEAKPVVIDLINGLNGPMLASECYEKAMEVLAIGSTSGYDLLLGIYQGLTLLQRMGEDVYVKVSCKNY